MGINQHRRTPDNFFKVLDAEFHFDVDVAADARNARCARWIGEEEDALRAPWFYGDGAAFCNPPWSDISLWLETAWSRTRLLCKWNVAAVVLSHGTDNTDAALFIEQADEVRFCVPRVQFSLPPGWYTCKACKSEHFMPSVYPNRYVPCPACHAEAPLHKPHVNSSNPRVTQVTVFRSTPLFNPEGGSPKLSYWRWQ